ncbi:MAG: response regulator [Gemmatimonadota bacterium]
MLEQPPLRVLIVDDDAMMTRLMELSLQSVGILAPDKVGTAAAALERVDACDIVLLDHNLPDGNGIDLLPILRARPNRPAVIVVTGNGNESLAAEALRRGADDYVIKDASLAALLPQVVERVRRTRALRDALAAVEQDLVHAERMAAIGQMNVTLHHTINNPLMTANAEVDLLLECGANLTAAQRESIGAIKGALQRIQQILERTRTLRHDQTADYLDGVKMIDLSRQTRPMPAYRGDAVVHVPDEDIARVIALLLRHAGFAVERVATGGAVDKSANRLGISLVVVAGMAGPHSSRTLGGLTPAAARTYTLVALVSDDGSAARAAGADHVVPLPFDPGTFVNDLLAVMR